MLHVTNGDAFGGRLRAAQAGDEVLPWNDVLHEGPVRAGLHPAALRAERAAFLAACGWADRDQAEAALAARDTRLAQAAADGEVVVLWFEHDLYDQLQLLQALDALAGARAAPGRVRAVLPGTFLTAADAASAVAAPVTADQLALAGGPGRPSARPTRPRWRRWPPPRPPPSLTSRRPCAARWRTCPGVATGLRAPSARSWRPARAARETSRPSSPR